MEISELTAPWSTTLEAETLLPAGQVKEFTFFYTPTATGSSSESFLIKTNVGEIVISLQGEAIGGTGLVDDAETSVVEVISPVSGGFVTIIAPEYSNVKIMDMTGRNIKTAIVSGSSLEVSLQNGAYFAVIKCGEQTYIRKFIIK